MDSPTGPWKRADFADDHRARRKRWVVSALIFCLALFVFLIIYGYTLGGSLPYSRLPRSPLIVTLPGYGTFKGTQVLRHLRREDPLDDPVDAWLGIGYARQPVGEYRFARSDWPAPFNGTRDAIEHGPACIQGGNPSDQTAGVAYSKKLPVLVFLHGGSFVMGSARSFDGASFVARSSQPLMVVTVQYRLSALGSLPSKLFEEEGLLNLGILDQRLALQFVQKHISVFGGDPDRVTLAGQSAGGHSVGIHLFHNYSSDAGTPLFSQAILSSGSSTARAFPEATSDLYKRQFNDFMAYLKCPMTPNAVALSCLRQASVADIRRKQVALYAASTYSITWPFQPVSPGPLLEKRGSQSGAEGTFFRIPILISSTTNEGTFFAPQNLETTNDFTRFLHTVNPGLNKTDLQDLKTLYPDPELPESPYAPDPSAPNHGKQFKRIVAAFGDYAYICPVQDNAARLSSAGAPVYKARFNTPNGGEPWMGIPHAADASYFNGVANVQYPEIAREYSGYWASFVVSGNPNTHAVEGAPVWERGAMPPLPTHNKYGGQEKRARHTDIPLTRIRILLIDKLT
ncbi:alpha/beta-hydrolase [Sporormia fimetaria CBS 119925]|uniref:Carboxylic ester hydrolase n=1 Tax=Sporormia fimetaria CBS 119925 TaxID=1340428 RepID=A0A6A6VKC9_9PLEO|nr:alpha/beta-hydrolase [Sporormia fimetaria CBS 119925]